MSYICVQGTLMRIQRPNFWIVIAACYGRNHVPHRRGREPEGGRRQDDDVDQPRRVRRLRSRVHADRAQITPEPRLEERARLRVERLAGPADCVAHDRGSRAFARRSALRERSRRTRDRVLLLARAALSHHRIRRLAADDVVGIVLFARRALALHDRCRRHAHHMLCRQIGFFLERIVGRADRKLSLNAGGGPRRSVVRGRNDGSV